jgi:hypothetical protein
MGALPTGPGLARAFTRMILGGWRLADCGDASDLIVSELATNVVQAATGFDGAPVYQANGRLTELWVRLMSDRRLLRIEIWDNLPANAGLPVIQRAGPEAESGRGLELVEALSFQWGWTPVPSFAAKSVWALQVIQ